MKLKKLLALVLCITMVLSTIGTVAFAEEATSETVTLCYTDANSFWGEAKTNSTESLVIEIYEDETKIAAASLNNIDDIIDGDVFVTWHINFGENNDEYWNVEWAEGYPKYDMNPTAVKLFADGVKVAENDVRFNGPDDLNKIVAFAEGNTGGVKAYTTLGEAVGDFNGRKVNVVRNVTESIESFNGCTLTTNVEGGVTIDNTYDDWVYANDFNIGNGVNVKTANFFYQTDGVNTVEGTLEVAETLYHGYDAKTTVNNGGKIAVGGTTILRYNKTADAGLYIYGDGDDSTVEFDCDYYIGAYSGTFYVENANVNAGYFLLKNSYDNETYADVDLTLDNSSIEVVGTTDGQDSFIIDDKASVTLKNGSAIEDVRDFNILAGTDLTLDVDSESSIEATNISVAKDVPVEIVDNGDGTFGVKTVIPVEVETYEELVAALAKDKSVVVMKKDIKATATQSSSYGVAGVVVGAGDILDGDGHKLTINGANGTWDCAIAITGGTVKNLTVAGAFRGIFMPGADGDVVIDNCKIDNVCYPFNSDAGSKEYGVTIKNTVLNGWTSFSDVHKFVTFESCTFGKGTGGYQYEYCRPYQETTFTGCEFNEGFVFDASATGDNTLEFNECTYNGEELSTGAGVEMFPDGGSIKIDDEESKLVADPVASVGLSTFATLEEAFAAAVDGDTITLHADCAVDNFNSTQDLTFDLNNNKFTFADANSVANENRHMVSHNITFKNGSIDIKADEFVNITATGAVTLDNVTSEMLGRTNTTFYVYGALKIVNGSDIKISTTGNAITSDYDWNVLNIDASTVTVDGAYLAYNNGDLNLNNGGKFIAKNIAGSAFNSVEAELTSGSEIVIDNAAYHGFTNGSLSLTDSTMTVTDAGYYGVNLTNDCTLDNSTLIVENCDLAKGRSGKSINVGAGKSLNVTNNSTVEVKGDGTTIYLANDTSSAIKDAASNIIGEIVTGNVTSEDSVASEVKLTFEPTAKQEVYNIYVEAVEGTINRMSAVQVKFALDNANMSYTLAPASELGVTLTNDIDDEEAYVFNYNGVSTPDRTGTKLLLGTVTFGGYGNFNFTVDEGFNNKIKTAQTTDNIVEEYVPTPDAANEKQGTFDIASSAITGAEVVEAKRDVKVVIDFNNDITAGNDADYNDMTVTLTGSNGEEWIGYVGSAPANDDPDDKVLYFENTAEKAEMTFNVTAGYRYTVVVKGEGYRTARYSTNVDASDDALVLTFWNNAKADENNNPVLAYIEDGEARSLKDVTFLAGDIAQDNIIDKYDLAAVVSYFGFDNLKTTNPNYVKYDLNRDGKIDADDISYVLVSWGK